MDALHWWRQGDAVTQGTALLLLAMSVASWVVILWKARVMRRALADVARCTAAFWQAPSLDVAVQRLQSRIQVRSARVSSLSGVISSP